MRQPCCGRPVGYAAAISVIAITQCRFAHRKVERRPWPLRPRDVAKPIQLNGRSPCFGPTFSPLPQSRPSQPLCLRLRPRPPASALAAASTAAPATAFNAAENIRRRRCHPQDMSTSSTPQKITMLLRASVLALAMITTLATTALVSSPASASWSFGRGTHGASDDWESHLGRSHSFAPLCRKAGGEQEARVRR
jgi:hypothetical protein